uniref:Arrestin-like N-terminal domain-containing protein n=1 Tax=Periophthalmus magnuspinnatus TaxID=409849 RepID=A0A3B3ZVY7_9GOBI
SKAGFLKSHHVYELIFTVPDVPTLGKDLSCSIPSSPIRRASYLKVNLTCEYKTHQEGVLQEELAVLTKGKRDSTLKVKLQAKVIDPHHGTPMLLEGVKCLGPVKDCHSKHCSKRI